MNEKEKRTIYNYDVDALKRNIEKRKAEIKIFQEEIKKAYQDIAKLESYIDMIEKEKPLRRKENGYNI